MSPMDKMWASFVAIGLMLIASLIITLARSKTRGLIRVLLSILAFLLLVPSIIYMIASMS